MIYFISAHIGKEIEVDFIAKVGRHSVELLLREGA